MRYERSTRGLVATTAVVAATFAGANVDRATAVTAVALHAAIVAAAAHAGVACSVEEARGVLRAAGAFGIAMGPERTVTAGEARRVVAMDLGLESVSAARKRTRRRARAVLGLGRLLVRETPALAVLLSVIEEPR